jgi:NAD(P)-dependent dehydrogenase (short-subunit alcohol dehydrogenase family)
VSTTKDLAGKTILVTGANTGIGRITAEVLAERGARVWLAGRSKERTQPVIDQIRERGGDAEFLALDLGDLTQVRSAAQTFLSTGEPLHVLVNNAGLAGQAGQTKQGFELAFGTNHLGPFLFTTLLLPSLRKSGSARIVNVASNAHLQTRAIDWAALREPTRTVGGIAEYNVSKLCNVLFTKELARGRAGAGVTSFALHPGVVASDVWRNVPWPIRPVMKAFMITTEEGAKTQIHCATSPDVAGDDGAYFAKCKRRPPNPLADDADLAKTLWEKSEEWTSP